MKTCRIYLLAGLMTFLTFSSCSDADSLLAPGISRELARLRKAKIDSLVYTLHFDIPVEKNMPIDGSVQIRCKLKKLDEDLVLDFNAPPEKIRSIIVNTEPIKVFWKQQHLLIPAGYLKPDNVIEIAFEAGEQSLNRNADYLYTLFVPERASTCFPLFDQPDLKAQYNLSLTIPTGWKALANGKIEYREDHERKTTYFFEGTKPLSSYLFSFVAGDFQVVTREVGDQVMNMFHRETDSAKLANNLRLIFEWHARSLAWMEEYTGIPHAFEKLDFVLIPSLQYSGMEHPRAVLYNASSLLLDESSTLNEQLRRARLIAHETAHMWFGNLVTMEWFNDVWLKEVFANLMAAKIVNPGFPDIDHELQFLFAHYPAAYRVDRTQGTHPVEQSLGNLKNAGMLYGNIIYKKAPIVMRMLEESVGERAFQQAMQQYLKRYSFRNASWNDLVSILAENAAFDVKEWNEQWIRSKGMPEVAYDFKSKPQNTTDMVGVGSPGIRENGGGKWRQNLHVLLGFSDTSYTVPADVLTNFKLTAIGGKHPPRYILPNSNAKSYGYFKMDDKSQKHFLQKGVFLSDPLLRAALWINLYEGMLRGHVAPDKLIKKALESLLKEDEALIAEYIIDVIHVIFWRYSTEEDRSALAPRLEGLLLNMLVHAPSGNLRSTYFNAFKSMAVSNHGILILKKLWSEEMTLDSLQLSEEDMTTLAYELAIRQVKGYRKILRQQKIRITNPDRKRRFAFIQPAVSANVEERDSFFESLKNPKNRENEAWVTEALAYLHHPLRAKDAIKYIRPSLEMLEEIQLSGDIFFPEQWLVNILSGHNSVEADRQVKNFLATSDHPPALKQKILQAADMLFRSAAYKQDNK